MKRKDTDMYDLTEHKWEIKEDSPLFILKDYIGKHGTLVKIGKRSKDGKMLGSGNFYTNYGRFSVIDRSGGPSIYICTTSEWFVTSWVLGVRKTEDNLFEIETENSFYHLAV